MDRELHQTDVKTTLLNGDIEEEAYMKQPEEFFLGQEGKLFCKFKKSIYELKQASHQWHIIMLLSHTILLRMLWMNTYMLK